MPSNALPWQPDASTDRHVVACLNYWGDLPLYSQGFLEGAEIMMRSIEAEDCLLDAVVYPVVYSLRHAVELALKQVIWAARSLLDDEVRGFPNGHDLGQLWSVAGPLLRRIWINDQGDFVAVEAVVVGLGRLDPGGEGFRYPFTKPMKVEGGKPGQKRRRGTLDGDLRHLDLRSMFADVKEAVDILDGADTGIDHYAGLKADAAEENRVLNEEINAEMEADMRAEMEGDW